MIAPELHKILYPEELPMSRFTFAALALSAALCANPAWASGLHEGDILVSVSGGKLKTNGGHDDLGKVFEGDFGDLAGGLYKTDDPGYDSEAGTFAQGTQLFYKALGKLSFWNGSHWSAANVPAGVSVQIEGNLGELTSFTASGVTGDLSGLIGQAGAGGSVHEHLDMSVAGANRTLPGAYMISLQLWSSSTALQASDPYHIVLNRGLSEDDFEAAVMAVPEPSTYAMLLLGLAAVGFSARRRRAR
jgi:hypothetical protein